jgi:branched-chain amino acid transport system permease protein
VSSIPADGTPPWRGRVLPLWRELAAGPSWRTTLVQVGVVAVLAAVVAFGVPGAVSPELLAVLTVAACYALLAAGTNISVGWLGSVTFGQAAFFGCGAYAVGLVRHGHWPAQNSILLAIAVSAVAGFVAYWLLARYTHITFAMLTLVFGQLVFLVVSSSTSLGASDGLGGLFREPVFGISTVTDPQFWGFAFAVLVIGLAVYWWFYRRILALRMFAVREDAGRMETLGYDVRTLRATAGALGAALSAMGGALYAMYAGATNPTLLAFTLSGAAIFMCFIGGSRYLWGPLIGAVLYTLTVNFWLQSNRAATLITGGIFVVVMLVIPNGLLSLPSRLPIHAIARRLRQPR